MKILKLLVIIVMTHLILSSANAQSWLLNGNINVTDTSRLGSINQKPVRFFAGNKEWMRLTEVGNFGIGVVPTSRFHLKGTASRLATFDGGTNMYVDILENGLPRGYWGSNSGSPEDFDLGTNSLNTSGRLHLTIRAVPKLTINTNGNVGIGTTTPTSLLSLLKTATGATADIRNTSLGPNISWIHFGSTGDWYIRSAANNGNIIIQDQSISGRVGIGTTTPATGYKLSVAGKIICEEVKVQLQANWPDYVFDNDYKLPSIDEMERYIQSHKHLPGVPTSAEIAKNKGIEIGEMQRIMLEKVEEQALYIIQLKKEL